jgi:hypothetical protein
MQRMDGVGARHPRSDEGLGLTDTAGQGSLDRWKASAAERRLFAAIAWQYVM